MKSSSYELKSFFDAFYSMLKRYNECTEEKQKEAKIVTTSVENTTIKLEDDVSTKKVHKKCFQAGEEHNIDFTKGLIGNRNIKVPTNSSNHRGREKYTDNCFYEYMMSNLMKILSHQKYNRFPMEFEQMFKMSYTDIEGDSEVPKRGFSLVVNISKLLNYIRDEYWVNQRISETEFSETGSVAESMLTKVARKFQTRKLFNFYQCMTYKEPEEAKLPGRSSQSEKFVRLEKSESSDYLTFRFKYEDQTFDRNRDFFDLDHATLLNLFPEYLSQVDFKLPSGNPRKTNFVSPPCLLKGFVCYAREPPRDCEPEESTTEHFEKYVTYMNMSSSGQQEMSKWVEYGQSKVKMLFSFQNVVGRLIQKKYFPLIAVYRRVEDLKNLEQSQEQINFLQNYLSEKFEECQDKLYEEFKQTQQKEEEKKLSEEEKQGIEEYQPSRRRRAFNSSPNQPIVKRSSVRQPTSQKDITGEMEPTDQASVMDRQTENVNLFDRHVSRSQSGRSSVDQTSCCENKCVIF